MSWADRQKNRLVRKLRMRRQGEEAKAGVRRNVMNLGLNQNAARQALHDPLRIPRNYQEPDY